MSDNKDRLTYRPEPETKQKIEQWYQEDNCRSKNEFIEKAVNCYQEVSGANVLPLTEIFSKYFS